MPLTPLTSDLWSVQHPLRVGGLQLGTRTMLVRLSGGGLLLHSPGPLGPALRSEVEELGRVRAILAPNRMHHLWVAENHRAFPQARLYAAPGVAEKQPSLHFQELLSDQAPAAWAGELDQHLVQGIPRLGEVAFFHRASRTLLLTDLVFNLRHSESWFTRLFMRMNGAYGRFGPTRLMRSLVRDRASLRGSIEHLLKWDFDRVTVTHGEILERGGREALRQAFEGI